MCGLHRFHICIAFTFVYVSISCHDTCAFRSLNISSTRYILMHASVCLLIHPVGCMQWNVDMHSAEDCRTGMP